jgi:hypothetical protein
VVRTEPGEYVVDIRRRARPWLGLFASVLASAAMLYGAVANISRRDFKHIGLPLTRQP